VSASAPRRICVRLLVRGLVQGVGFRAATHREALRIGQLEGWVRNLPSGEVEALVQGSPEKVAALLKWCEQGGPGLPARVDHVSKTEQEADSSLGPFAINR